MSDADDVVPVGLVTNDAGDTVEIGLQAGKVHVEVANVGREPVEVWLAPSDAALLADVLRRAAGA